MHTLVSMKMNNIGKAAAFVLVSALTTFLLVSCGQNSAAKLSSETQMQAIAVDTIAPATRAVNGDLSLAGTVRARDDVRVVAETAGKVLAVYATLGQVVSRGQALALIDNELKQASLETAQAAFDKSKADWERAQDLYSQKVISESDRQGARLGYANADAQLKMARRDFENATVRSPLDGVVSQKFVSVGTMLSPGAPVAQVTDVKNLKLTVQVSEKEILKIRTGMKVQISSELHPGIIFPGKVTAVSPKGDAALTFPVEISLTSDPAHPLYDGMSARASVNLGERTILAIPRAAVIGSQQQSSVFVVSNGIARQRAITVGNEYGTEIEVLSGLSLSDRVVNAGQNLLVEGSPVTQAVSNAQ